MTRTHVGLAVAGVVAAVGIAGCGLVLDLGDFSGTPDGGAIVTGAPDSGDARTGVPDSRVSDGKARPGDSARDVRVTDSGKLDAGTDAAVGALGAPCTTAGALSCNGHDSRESLICASNGSGLVWEGNGQCQAETRCDTAAGPDLGTCQPIVPVCDDAGPGQPVCTTLTECDGGTDSGLGGGAGCTSYPQAVRCGPDLVTTIPIETCVSQACTAGACTGSCDPASTRCSGGELETCSAAATWGNATPCPGALVDGGSGSPTKECCGVGCIDTSTDLHNCGGCGKQCSGVCAAGVCSILLSNDANAGPVAIDTTNAYWIDISGSAAPSVWKVALSGGTPVRLYTPAMTTDGGSNGYPTLGSIAVDATHVYWTEQADKGVIKQMLLTGGTPTILATDATKISGLAVDASSIYWADSSGAILKAPLSPGLPTSLASGETLPTGFEASEQQLALDSAAHLYWLNSPPNAVVRVGITGGTPVTESTDTTAGDTMSGIAASGERVFWAVSTSGAVGGNLVTYNGATGIVSTLATNLDIGFDYPGVATNSTTVTWIGRMGFMSMIQTGGPITTLSPNRPNFIAMNATSGVWADYQGVHVVTLP